MSFLWNKTDQNVIFRTPAVFENTTFWEIFKWKSNAFFFNPIYDALCFFQSEHWRLVESLSQSQVKDSDTQNSTIRLYIAGLYHVLKKVRSARCLITLLRYTLSYYIVELYAILTQCRGISNFFTLLSNSQNQSVTEVFLILHYCCCISCLITLLSPSQSQNNANV